MSEEADYTPTTGRLGVQSFRTVCDAQSKDFEVTYWQMQYTCRCGAVSTMELPTDPLQCRACGNALEAQ